MAGDWIKMRTNLRTHPKVVRMSSALQCDALRVIGALWAVWSIADEHAAAVDGAGHLDGYSLADMSAVIAFPGFAEQMALCGWLDECEEHAENGGKCLIFKAFDTHNGQSAKRRAEDSERKRTSRAVSTRPQSVRKVSAERPAETVTREEKRREEINTHSGATAEGVVGVEIASQPEHEHGKDEKSGATVMPEAQPTAAGRVCKLLRQAGIPDVNPGHPDLLALLSVGCTDPEFVGAAADVVRRGKGFAYLLSMLTRQRKAAASSLDEMHKGALPVAGGGTVAAGSHVVSHEATQQYLRELAAHRGQGSAEVRGQVRARLDGFVAAAAGG